MNRTARQLFWIPLLAGLGLLLGSPPPLRAEPTYVYSTFLGGTSWDFGEEIATTPSGNVYIALVTHSDDFLELTGPPQGPPPYSTYNLNWVTVVALDSAGGLLYSTSTFASPEGNMTDVGGIAVAPDGTVVVVGTVFSLFRPNSSLVFYVRISPSGEWIKYGFLGGGLTDTWAEDVTMDAAGNFYVTGTLWDEGVFNGSPSTFVAKIGAGGYFMRIDSSGYHHGTAIGLDSAGNAIVTGLHDGDGFLTWVSPTGSVIRSITFGGSGGEEPRALAVTPDGDVIITGTTFSADFPTLNPVQPALKGSPDVFLTRFSSDGEMLASTYLGGSAMDAPNDLAAGPDGKLYLLSVLDTHYPPDPGWDESPLLTGDLSCRSALIARLDPEDFTVLDTACIAKAYGASLAVDPAGWISVTGFASEGFNLVNPAQGFYAGEHDAFAVRMTMNRPPDCSGAAAHPAVIWPPNNKLVPVSILGVEDPDGDPIHLMVTGIRQDEPRTGQSVDASGVGTAQPSVRAQRSGGGDGRVYHIAFQVLDAHGELCAGEVSVCVPHDASGSDCGDGGALVDSTGR